MTKRRIVSKYRDCNTCFNCVAIGEGAFLCTEKCEVVIEDYCTPTEEYRTECGDWEG